jgi:branched-chain amino acid transport system substrate-binding protein
MDRPNVSAQCSKKTTGRIIHHQDERKQAKKCGVGGNFILDNGTSITMKTSANVGFKTQWVSSSGLSDYPLMNKITGGLWEGVITGAFVPPPDSGDPLVAKYQKAAQRLAPDERWGVFYMAGIQFAEPLVEALKLVGPKLSTEACIEKLNGFKNWKGLGGAITWNKNRHQGTDSVQIHQCGPGGKSILLQDWTANELAAWKK